MAVKVSLVYSGTPCLVLWLNIVPIQKVLAELVYGSESFTAIQWVTVFGVSFFYNADVVTLV